MRSSALCDKSARSYEEAQSTVRLIPCHISPDNTCQCVLGGGVCVCVCVMVLSGTHAFLHVPYKIHVEALCTVDDRVQ